MLILCYILCVLHRDAENKRKLKEIYAQLADQEGDFQALKRKKDSADS